MRATFDLHRRGLAAALAKASAGRNHTVGEAVSDLALAGLAAAAPVAVDDHGLVLMPVVPGHVITDEMVAEAMLDE